MLHFLQCKSEIPYGIVVADIFHDFFQQVIILGVFSIFNPSPQQFTQNPAEIFMPGVGKKASGIRKHSHKAGQISQICQRGKLFLDAGLVVVEPPGTSLLDLSPRLFILETADDGADGSVVIGI